VPFADRHHKDMHYAEFAEDEVRSSFIILFLFSFLFFFFECDMSQSKMTSQSIALREAIKEYEANKWKVIGQKVGKPAKVGMPLNCSRTAEDFPSLLKIYRLTSPSGL
jgi:hypothetical protein